jgi:preprotein translocase subunit SecG
VTGWIIATLFAAACLYLGWTINDDQRTQRAVEWINHKRRQ